MSFLSAVSTFLAGSTGGTVQIREVTEAAQAVEEVPEGVMREALQSAFWDWLQTGRWQYPSQPLEQRLEERSRLDQAAIEENYRDGSARYDYNRASEAAVRAWERRVARCVQALAAGRPQEECISFVYCRDEWREALEKARATGRAA